MNSEAEEIVQFIKCSPSKPADPREPCEELSRAAWGAINTGKAETVRFLEIAIQTV